MSPGYDRAHAPCAQAKPFLCGLGEMEPLCSMEPIYLMSFF